MWSKILYKKYIFFYSCVFWMFTELITVYVIAVCVVIKTLVKQVHILLSLCLLTLNQLFCLIDNQRGAFWSLSGLSAGRNMLYLFWQVKKANLCFIMKWICMWVRTYTHNFVYKTIEGSDIVLVNTCIHSPASLSSSLWRSYEVLWYTVTLGNGWKISCNSTSDSKNLLHSSWVL